MTAVKKPLSCVCGESGGGRILRWGLLEEVGQRLRAGSMRSGRPGWNKEESLNSLQHVSGFPTQ